MRRAQIFPPERVQRHSGGQVPEPDLLVLAPRREPLAGRVEGHAVDGIAMTLESPFKAAGVRIPELDRVVVAGRGEVVAIGAERDRRDTVGMPFRTGCSRRVTSSQRRIVLPLSLTEARWRLSGWKL